MNNICRLSGDQKYCLIGRLVSAVSGRADFGSAAEATKMLSTPSRGAIQLSHLPSGDRRPATWVGLPKIFSRGMSGTFVWATAGRAATVIAAQAASSRDLAFIGHL
jgi:hypothetical protein